MIALAILSTGLFGAIRVFPVGLRASRRSQTRSLAAITAQRTIESLKLAEWDSLTEGETVSEDGGFDVATRIRRAAVEPLVDDSRLKTVEVTVRWTEEQRPRELTLSTYLRGDGS